jgi:PKD repeat protein
MNNPMKILIQKLFVALALLAVTTGLRAHASTIFPIATNVNVVQLAAGLATDGTNYLVVFSSGTNVCAQLVASNGTLTGSAIIVGGGAGGLPPQLQVVSGHTNYLVAWSDNSMNSGVDIFGQSISRSGAKVGSKFPLLQSVGSHGFQGIESLACDGTNFLVIWQDEKGLVTSGGYSTNSSFGQLVTPSGALSGSEFQVANVVGPLQAQGLAVSFGKTNYLAVWQSGFNLNRTNGNYSTYGAFISRSGVVGSQFAISQMNSPGNNTMAAAFDGTNYLATWNYTPLAIDPIDWRLHGRLVSPQGGFPGNELALADESSMVQSLAFDGASYLAAWGYHTDTTNADKNIHFRFFDSAANPSGPVFNVFSTQGTNSPLFPAAGNGVVFDGKRFAIGAVLGTVIIDANGIFAGLPSAQVYGAFISTNIPASIQYTATPTNGTPPLTVQFNSPSVDSSGINVVSWNWNFGDGATSTLQNPSHTYTTAGIFTPTLVATNNNDIAVIGSGPSIIIQTATAADQFTYTTNDDNTITITGYIGTNDTVAIPSTISGLPVTDIGDFAFESYSITNVTIPNTVIRIEDWAFQVGFASVTIPNSITSIGSFAFVNCYNLNSITIPSSVTYVGEAPFASDTSLVAITVDAANAYYTSVGGVLFDKSQTTLIQYPEGNTATSYIIPNGVTTIGGNALGAYYLTSVTIPNSVTSIGQEAFAGSSLSSIVIPNSVVSIGAYAFQDTLLTSVEIPSSVTDLGQWPFFDCTSLTAINVDSNNPAYSSVGGVLFDKSLTTLLEYPAGATTTTYSVPTTVTSIGDQAFSECTSLTSITVPNSVASIGGLAFSYCSSLTSVYFEGNAPSADSSTFDGDSATAYYLPGTTGWSTNYYGLPTALWTLPYPIILTGTSGFGVQPNGFSFDISWATNLSIVVEACTNLSNPI